MRFLPIVERELRVAARHRGTWWVRFGAALVALIVGGWVMLIPGFRTPQTMGIALFVSLAIVIYLYCILSGIRTTTDSLSEEKREGTLGLLFLTDLKGYDIVFGKLAATSLNALYGLLAVLPVLAIPLLLGGVAIEEFWRVSLCSLNALFFSLSVGMFCSAISRDEVKSMAAALILIVLFTGGLPLIGGLFAAFGGSRYLSPAFFVPSPGYSAFLSFDEIYQQMTRSKFNYFTVSVITVHALSWLFLGLSCYIVPRTWQVKAESVRRIKVRNWFDRWKYGSRQARLFVRRKMLEFNPIYWLTGRNRLKPTMLWLVLSAGAMLWIYGLTQHPRDWKDDAAYLWTAFFTYYILTVWLSSEACRQFAMDRKSGALELILSTPVTIREMLRGQIAGLQRQFLGPIVVVVVVNGIFLWATRGDMEWAVFWLCVILSFLMDNAALTTMGMWNGLVSGNIGKSTSKGILMILVMPWIIWGALMTVLGISGFFSNRFFRGNNDWVPLFIMFSRFIIGMFFAGWFGFHAWYRLKVQFRVVATRSFAKRKGGLFGKQASVRSAVAGGAGTIPPAPPPIPTDPSVS